MRDKLKNLWLLLKSNQTKNIFFKYANRFRKSLSSPSIVVDKDNHIVTDPFKIANKLQEHFQSVFTQPNVMLNPTQNFVIPNVKFPLSSFYLSSGEIIKAIEEMKPYSACPRSGIPSQVFKKCKLTLSLPLKLFWEKSLPDSQARDLIK